MRVAVWYWALLGLWAAAYVAVSLTSGELNLRTPVFLVAVFMTASPLLGVLAFIALLVPLIALPFALRRAMVADR